MVPLPRPSIFRITPEPAFRCRRRPTNASPRSRPGALVRSGSATEDQAHARTRNGLPSIDPSRNLVLRLLRRMRAPVTRTRGTRSTRSTPPRSGLDGGGAGLVGQALGGDSPKLRLNPLETENDRNEQKGFEQILRGMYVGIRNPRSHETIADSKETADRIQGPFTGGRHSIRGTRAVRCRRPGGDAPVRGWSAASPDSRTGPAAGPADPLPDEGPDARWRRAQSPGNRPCPAAENSASSE